MAGDTLPLQDQDIVAALPPAPRTVNLRDLMRSLGLDRRERSALKARLEALVDAGKIERYRSQRYGLCPVRTSVRGAILVTRRGFGFVVTDGDGPDVYVAGHHLGTALHRDRVRIEVQEGYRGKPEGRVVEVLQRGTHTFVGVLHRGRRATWIDPTDERLPEHFGLVGEVKGRDGDLVAAEIVAWPETVDDNPTARVLRTLAVSGEAAEETELAIYAQGLPTTFSADTVAQAERWDDAALARAAEGRLDLRERPLLTIDPQTARDFDDAVCAERLEGGGWRLTVAIADVAEFVTQGSAIDRDARLRGTSVYLPDRVLPMLPARLSADLCSLRPDVDRLALAVAMTVSVDGHVSDTVVSEAVIRSHARFTYDRAAFMLGVHPDSDGGATDPSEAHERLRGGLENLLDVSRVLRRRRKKMGYLNLDLAEPRIELDTDGKVVAIRRTSRHEVHLLVEDAMLAANELVARRFVDDGKETLFRVHGSPADSALDRFRAQAAALDGGQLKGNTARSMSRYLKGLKDHPYRDLLHILLLRAMMRAEYRAEVAPHFGLGMASYLHFTSPIRRYPDLIVHRMIKAALRGARFDEALAPLAVHCSWRERVAVDAERDVTALYKALFMAKRVGEVFGGTVMGVTTHGFFVTLDEALVEGFVSVDRPQGPRYQLSKDGAELYARRSGDRIGLGARFRLKLVNVSPGRRRIELEVVERLD